MISFFRPPAGAVVEACQEAIGRVMGSQWFILGAEVEAFEREFAAWCGVDACVSVANGTDALELALRACGVGAGDGVALAANAGYYGSIAVNLAGATPLYVDIDEATMTMDPASLARVLESESRPKAVIVTHLYGRLANIEELCELAARAGVTLIEDCAQAHGAMRGGRKAGSFGALGCFSFYPTKNLGALGDGGAVVTSDPALAARLRQLRQYGWASKYHVALPGGRNSRLDEMQAAVLRVRLSWLEQWNASRRDIARRYSAAFASLPLAAPAPVDDAYVAHLYVVRSPERDALRAHLAARGVATDIHYPVADHRQAVAAQGAGGACSLPVTERACATVLSLPCFPGLGAEEADQVIAAVSSYFAARN